MNAFLAIFSILLINCISKAQAPIDYNSFKGNYSPSCFGRQNADCSLSQVSGYKTFINVDTYRGAIGCPAQGHIMVIAGRETYFSTADADSNDRHNCLNGNLFIFSNDTGLKYSFDGLFSVPVGSGELPLLYKKKLVTNLTSPLPGSIEIKQEEWQSCDPNLPVQQCLFCEAERKSTYCKGKGMFCERDRYRSCINKTRYYVRSAAGLKRQ